MDWILKYHILCNWCIYTSCYNYEHDRVLLLHGDSEVDHLHIAIESPCMNVFILTHIVKLLNIHDIHMIDIMVDTDILPIFMKGYCHTMYAWHSYYAMIAIHKSSRECMWLRSMIHLIQEKCGLKCDKVPMILYEDNATCIAQLKEGFIKGERTKHISPKLFYIHELQMNGDINVQ